MRNIHLQYSSVHYLTKNFSHSIARNLGINRVFIHKYSSILSAYGMGLANVVNEQQEPSSIVFKEESYEKIDERIDYLKEQSRKKLLDQGFTDEQIDYELYLNMRYDKTDFAIMVKPYVTSKSAPYCAQSNFEKAFIDRYRREFGFTMYEHAVLVDDIRVRGVGKSHFNEEIENDKEIQPNLNGTPSPDSMTDVYFEELGYQKTAVYKTNQLIPGNLIDGPSIVINDNSTILVEPGCTLEITKRGNMLIRILQVRILMVEEQKVTNQSFSQIGNQTNDVNRFRLYSAVDLLTPIHVDCRTDGSCPSKNSNINQHQR